MAAGDVHGDGSYSLEEEIELLEAIYIHELTLEGARERPTAVSVLLHPSTGDEEDKRFVCLTLVIYLPDKYPLELPSIHIKTPRGLSEAHVESILANLRELAEGCLGRPMLYELIEYAKESLTDNNTPSCACAICLCHFQDNHEFTKTECYHYFHCGCLARYIEFSLQQEKEADRSTKVECPMCRLPITYNLAELKTVACSEGNEEEEVYEPSVEIRKLQKKMSSLFEKQKRKGGVIDVEQERNRFLIDITSVRQEETIPESEPPTGAESDTVAKNPSREDTVHNSPKNVDPAKENAQPDNFSCKDKPEKRDKKEFSKYSGPPRGARRPVSKTGNQSGEEKFRHNEQRRAEKKRPTTGDRPKSSNQREKESTKKPEQHGSDFALWTDAKPDSTRSGLESKKNNSVVDNPGRAGRGVSESTQSGSTQRGLETEKNTGVVDPPGRGGRGVSESTQSGSTQPSLETKKNTSERGVSERSGNSNSSRNSNEERPRSARRGRGRSGRGRPFSGSTKKPQGNANKSRTSSEGAVKQSGMAGSSEHSKPPPGKNGGSQDQRHSLQQIPDKEKRSSSGNENVCKPPPGFKNLKVDKGGCEQSSNVHSRPPPGFEHSTRPRPPPGLGNLAEGAGQNSNQSIAS